MAVSEHRKSVSPTGKLTGGATVAALLLLLSCGTLLNAAKFQRLYWLNEVNWGDSYILYDAMHFQRTGVIYRDLSQPPYLPAQYSPLVYIMYALTGRASAENPFFRPRILSLSAFLICLGMVCAIVKVLIPVRIARLWALLLASSIHCMGLWLGQLRADFPGIFFGLATVRLLLARSPYAVLLAGTCAGLALQFKITYVAPLIAGALWLLLRRQWKGFLIFVASGALASAGLYLLFWLREPAMISQMLALRPGISDPAGCLDGIVHILREPVVLLALPALPLVANRSWPRWGLLLLFASLSFTFGALTDLQAGGNLNYFFESLFALVPLAVLGSFRLITWSRSQPGLALFLMAVTLILFPQLMIKELHEHRAELNPYAMKAQNKVFRQTEWALKGQHIFSTIPHLALLDPQPALLEPYLLTYMQRMGKFNPQPIVERIRNDEFDIVITASDPQLEWRGVRRVAPDIENAIRAGYRPYCAILDDVLHVPRSRPTDSALALRLHEAGCVPYAPSADGSAW